MAIPDFQACLLPLLRYLGDGEERTISEATEHIAGIFNLSEEEKHARIPSGRSPVIRNRVGWARTYLHKAGLVESPRRGVWKISPLGKTILEKNPPEINVKFLEQFPGFVEFQKRSRTKTVKGGSDTTGVSDATPDEILESAWRELRARLEEELLEVVKSGSSGFFEQLVVDLLVRMGYGGSRADAGQALGKSGDGGIDGRIKEDRLGLDVIYVQAKKWEGTVGRPEIQKFAGALQGAKARKGVFLTTGTFSREAVDYASSIDSNMVLIDGEELARLMIDHDLGVTTVQAYEVKQLDSDYFDEG